MNKMKKLIIVVTSLIAMIVILVGCSNEKNKQTNQDNGVCLQTITPLKNSLKK